MPRKRSAPDGPGDGAEATKTKASVADGKKRASRSGLTGEKIVRDLAKKATEAGVAWLHKIPTDSIWTRRGRQPTRKSVTDFLGFMLDGGRRAIALEVKRTAKKHFWLGEVEGHQAEVLDMALAAGHLAILVVVLSPTDTARVVPWQDVPRNQPSVSREWLLGYTEDETTFLRRFAQQSQPANDVTLPALKESA